MKNCNNCLNRKFCKKSKEGSGLKCTKGKNKGKFCSDFGYKPCEEYKADIDAIKEIM